MVGASSDEDDAESSEEEEEETTGNTEDEASDGIEITETFDEVEFGDGDESHHIYCHMSGINITWHTCEEDTFKVFRDELCDMFGVGPRDFYITYYTKYIKDDLVARELPNGSCVSINFRAHGGGKRAASSSSKVSAERLERKEKEREIEKKLMLMKIEEGAKKFTATEVDNDVQSLSIKMKRMTESEIGNLLISELEKMSALELTTLKEEYTNTKHMEKRMELITLNVFPEAAAIEQKIKQLKDILETTKLTVTQVYDEEFKGSLGRGESAFGITLTKLISQKLGAPQDGERKKARRQEYPGPRGYSCLFREEYPRGRRALSLSRRRISPTSAREVRTEQPRHGDIHNTPNTGI